MLLAELHDVLEPRDDPFLARGAGADRLERQIDAQFGEDIVVGHVSHRRRRNSSTSATMIRPASATPPCE